MTKKPTPKKSPPKKRVTVAELRIENACLKNCIDDWKRVAANKDLRTKQLDEELYGPNGARARTISLPFGYKLIKPEKK